MKEKNISLVRELLTNMLWISIASIPFYFLFANTLVATYNPVLFVLCINFTLAALTTLIFLPRQKKNKKIKL
jgi:uncharacterized integral membrane protein